MKKMNFLVLKTDALETSSSLGKTGRMKSLLTIFALVFTMMFSSTSFAEWTKVFETESGNTHYVDFERIRKHDGYIYWWELIDLLQPTATGMLSQKTYIKGDCKVFRYQFLSISRYKEPMLGGTDETFTYNDDQWEYPSPISVMERKLKKICNQ